MIRTRGSSNNKFRWLIHTSLWICYLSYFVVLSHFKTADSYEYFEAREELSYDLDTAQSQAKYDARLLTEQMLSEEQERLAQQREQHKQHLRKGGREQEQSANEAAVNIETKNVDETESAPVTEDEDDLQPHERAASCYTNGHKYTHGQKVPRLDTCEVCLCMDGEIFCWWEKCDKNKIQVQVHDYSDPYHDTTTMKSSIEHHKKFPTTEEPVKRSKYRKQHHRQQQQQQEEKHSHDCERRQCKRKHKQMKAKQNAEVEYKKKKKAQRNHRISFKFTEQKQQHHQQQHQKYYQQQEKQQQQQQQQREKPQQQEQLLQSVHNGEERKQGENFLLQDQRQQQHQQHQQQKEQNQQEQQQDQQEQEYAQKQKQHHQHQQHEHAHQQHQQQQHSQSKILDFPANLPALLYYDYKTEEHEHHQNQHHQQHLMHQQQRLRQQQQKLLEQQQSQTTSRTTTTARTPQVTPPSLLSSFELNLVDDVLDVVTDDVDKKFDEAEIDSDILPEPPTKRPKPIVATTTTIKTTAKKAVGIAIASVSTKKATTAKPTTLDKSTASTSQSAAAVAGERGMSPGPTATSTTTSAEIERQPYNYNEATIKVEGETEPNDQDVEGGPEGLEGMLSSEHIPQSISVSESNNDDLDDAFHRWLTSTELIAEGYMNNYNVIIDNSTQQQQQQQQQQEQEQQQQLITPEVLNTEEIGTKTKATMANTQATATVAEGNNIIVINRSSNNKMNTSDNSSNNNNVRNEATYDDVDMNALKNKNNKLSDVYRMTNNNINSNKDGKSNNEKKAQKKKKNNDDVANTSSATKYAIIRSTETDYSSEANGSVVKIDISLTTVDEQQGQQQQMPHQIYSTTSELLTVKSIETNNETKSTSEFNLNNNGNTTATTPVLATTTTTTTTTTTIDPKRQCNVMGTMYNIGDILPQDTGNCLQCICSIDSTPDDTPRVTCSPHNCPPLVLPDLLDATGY